VEIDVPASISTNAHLALDGDKVPFRPPSGRVCGCRLSDVLRHAGLDDPIIDAQETQDLKHVRFYSLDGMTASIGIEKAMNPYGDCIIAYEMNGEILPRDHGYPLRVSSILRSATVVSTVSSKKKRWLALAWLGLACLGCT
jgi:hypothetical protein